MRRLVIEPLGKRVVVKRDAATSGVHTALVDGELVILHKSQKQIDEEARCQGVVEAVGPEVTSVQVGDRVLVPEHGSQGFLGTQSLIYFEADVLARLRFVDDEPAG